MRNLKRVLSLALALVMVLGMMVITTSAADFTDAEEITYTEAVEVMTTAGIIKGNPNADGTFTFNPQGNLTREGAAKILAFVCMGAEADNYLTGSAAIFTDVPADRWSAKYVAYCSNLGIINGNGDGTFNPEGNISVVGFAKLLLGAIEAEGTFTGLGWEENVKKAVAKVPTMAATGIKITNADITREEACELALAAMKAGETYSNGWYIEGYEEEFGYSESYADAYIMAKAMEIDSPEIKKHTATQDALLEDVYGLTWADSEDDFGRPGVRYTDIKTSGKKVNKFFVDEKFTEYKGEVKGGTLYTDLGEPKSVTVQVYVDGNKWVASNATVASLIVEDGKANAITDNKGNTYTGNSVVTEVYETGEDAYTFVVINTYAGTVSKFTPANEKTEKAAYITVNGIDYETEDFAKGDDVLYTKANGKIQSIELAVETVAGTPTKNANGVYTVNGETYAKSMKSTAALELGKKGEWYVDAYGNLIANKGEKIIDAETEYTYAVVLEVGAVDYKEAEEGTLIDNGKDAVEAKELLKVKLADDSVVVLSTAWEYTKNDKGEITGVEWINGGTDYTVEAGALIKYAVDEDGKVTEIVEAGNYTGSAGSVEGGKATVAKTGGVWSSILTDDTVVYMAIDGKYEVAVGYKNIADATFVSADAFYNDGLIEAVLLKGAALTEEEVEGDDHVVYFADVKYTEEWDAEANKGKGAIVYVYENVYVDGVKATLTFAAEQTSAVAGELYAYNTEDGVTYTNLLGDEGTVTLIQSGFFKADEIVYTDADTVYYEITKDGLAVADGLPAVKEYTTTIKLFVEDSKTDVATIVYFSAVEIEE